MPVVAFGDLIRPRGLFSSESVSDGHPDKICDQISDAILDAALAQDRHARVAVEAAAKGRAVWVFGEISGAIDLDIEAIVRDVYRDIGHAHGRWGIAADELDIRVDVSEQSQQISDGVDRNSSGELGAGDQGLMFGYAEAGTSSRLPLPIDLAHQLMRAQKDARRRFPVLGPDAKSQVTVDLSADGFRNVTAVVLSSQHSAEVSLQEVRDLIHAEILLPVLGDRLTPDAQILVNPSGPFVAGGPVADAGLTGRKIIVDSYGGFARHGGGAFSGKDATKVDRSAAYAARQLARSVVDAGLAHACEVRLAYAIGVPHPVAMHLDTLGRREGPVGIDPCELLEAMTPGAIISRLDLRRPIFRATSTFGHFGREEFPWENDNAGALAALGIEPAVIGSTGVSGTTLARQAAHAGVTAMKEANLSDTTLAGPSRALDKSPTGDLIDQIVLRHRRTWAGAPGGWIQGRAEHLRGLLVSYSEWLLSERGSLPSEGHLNEIADRMFDVRKAPAPGTRSINPLVTRADFAELYLATTV